MPASVSLPAKWGAAPSSTRVTMRAEPVDLELAEPLGRHGLHLRVPVALGGIAGLGSELSRGTLGMRTPRAAGVRSL